MANPNAGSIDAHAHWAPESYVELVEQLGHIAGAAAPQPAHVRSREAHAVDGRAQREDARAHALGQLPWQWASQDDANKLARIVNDAAIEAHKAFPGPFRRRHRDSDARPESGDAGARSRGGPARHARSPSAEFGRSASDYIFEPEYLPLIARCEELGYPLLFHPLDGVDRTTTAGPERLAGDDFIYNTLGFPFETATTAAKFIISGLLDKFPKLDIVLPHSGGCFPYIAGRIEHSIKKGVRTSS